MSTPSWEGEIIRAPARGRKPKLLWPLGLLLAVSAILVSLYAFPQKASVGTTATDDFSRGNGSLGPNWTAMSGHRLVISSHAVTGTSASGVSGEMRASNAFTNDQYSQVEVTSTQLTGSQWIGLAVRAQGGGQNAYLGMYWWNGGSPELKLFLRHAGNWTPIGSVYNSGPLAAGTKLELMAVGNTISFLENGVQRISAADSTLSGGRRASWPTVPRKPTIGPAEGPAVSTLVT